MSIQSEEDISTRTLLWYDECQFTRGIENSCFKLIANKTLVIEAWISFKDVHQLELEYEKNYTVSCGVNFQQTLITENVLNIRNWKLPKMEIFPQHISGYHQQPHLLMVTCTSQGGIPAGDIEFWTCDKCDKDLLGMNITKSTNNGTITAKLQLQLDYHRHHGKK